MNSALPEELYLSLSNQNLSDSLNLAPAATAFYSAGVIYLRDSSLRVQGSAVMRGITFTLKASGKASSTGSNGQMMDIEIPLAFTGANPGASGDPIVANIQALATKSREAARGSGAGSLAMSVWLWMKFVNSSNYVYWALDGPPDVAWLKPAYPGTTPILAALVTFHCLPYAFGDPVYDAASVTLTPTSPSIYRSGLPGDHEAATRLWLLDQSGNGKQAQQWTLYNRSLDNMGANDWPPTYGLTAVSPAVATSDAAAYNGTRAHLASVTANWQNVGYAQSGAGAFESQEALVKLRVRGSEAPCAPPSGFGVSLGAANSGNFGTGIYQFMAVPKDASGNYGPNSALVQVPITLLSQGGGQPMAITYVFEDGFESGGVTNWPAGFNTTTIAGSPTFTTAVNAAALFAGSFGADLKTVSTASNYGIARLLWRAPALTANKIWSAQAEVKITTMTASQTQGVPVAYVQAHVGSSVVTFGLGSSDGTNFYATYTNGSPPTTFAAFAPAQVNVVSSAHSLAAGFHLIEVTADASGDELAFKLTVDGVVWGGVTVSPPSSGSNSIDEFGWQAGAYNGSYTTEIYVDNVVIADSYIGGASPAAGYSIVIAGTPGANAANHDLFWQTDQSSIVYKLPNIGASPFPYTLSNQLPSGVQLAASFPTATPPVQHTLLRVGTGLTLAEAQANAASAPAVPIQVASNEWEYLGVRTKQLPPSVIPEGQLAPPWYAAVQAMNPGTATAPSLDVDQFVPLPKDGDVVTAACPLTLTRPAMLQLDTRRDGHVSAIWYDTGTVTASGNEVTDVTREAATLDDGLAVPGGYGVYPSGTVLTHGTVAGNPRLQVTASGLIGATTGWIGIGYVPKDASAGRRLFSWTNGTTAEIIEVYYDGANFVLSRQHSSSGASVSVAHALTLGAFVEVLAFWTGTTLALSVNGSVFSTVANSAIPSGLTSTFDIATRASISSGSTDLYGPVVWFACGTATPSSADATGLYPVTPSVGLSVGLPAAAAPTNDWFSAAASVQFAWQCRTARYWLPGTRLAFGTFNGELRAGAPNTIIAALPEYYDASANLISDVADASFVMQARYTPTFDWLRGQF